MLEATQQTKAKLIADVQNLPDHRKIPINKVGIKSVKYPIHFIDYADNHQHTVANFDMLVDLSAEYKGTHMSRFIELLEQHQQPISVNNFAKLAQTTRTRLMANRAYLTMIFNYFMKKSAPMSGAASLLDYQVNLSVDCQQSNADLYINLVVPVTSLCPCSKQISKYGAHNQRSTITIFAKIQPSLWIEELIKIAEQHASCEIYGLLKREDEKYVTEKAYENPKFVEDIVRDLAISLNNNPKILGYRIESENFESIHNHSAYAMIEKNI